MGSLSPRAPEEGQQAAGAQADYDPRKEIRRKEEVQGTAGKPGHPFTV